MKTSSPRRVTVVPPMKTLPVTSISPKTSSLPGISTTQSSGEANKVVIRGLSPKYNSIEIDSIIKLFINTFCY